MPRTRTLLSLLAAAAVLSGCNVFTSSEPSEEDLAAPSRQIQPLREATSAAEPTPAAAPPAPGPAARPPVEVRRPTPEAGGISARHILIQYQGSTRASDQITRSRDEALAEAERVAGLARQEGADFAALAREHSDGPTGPAGGDLGSFPRGQMHPAFENAAFDLDVDEVSGVVETPFGFHVIQRYR